MLWPHPSVVVQTVIRFYRTCILTRIPSAHAVGEVNVAFKAKHVIFALVGQKIYGKVLNQLVGLMPHVTL